MKPSPTHHPQEERLLAYATGASDLSLRLLVEAHLGFCPTCAARVARFAAPGGVLLEAMPEEPLPGGLFARIWEEARQREPPPPEEGFPVPSSLLAELPPVESWQWRPLPGTGNQRARLVREAPHGASLELIHLGAGARLPRHVHRSTEEVLVLAGGVWEQGRWLESGDWSVSPAGSSHTLEADSAEGCWALTRMEGRPAGPRGPSRP